MSISLVNPLKGSIFKIASSAKLQYLIVEYSKRSGGDVHKILVDIGNIANQSS